MEDAIVEDATGESVTQSPNADSMADLPWWKAWLAQLVIYAAKDPWQFLYYVLLILTPFFLVSAGASYYLAKDIEKKEKKKKKALKKEQNRKHAGGKEHLRPRKEHPKKE